jgi:hypothetical protein
VIAERSDGDDCLLRPDDLFVGALSVQGGEAIIGGETTAFARIIMTGVDVKDVGVASPAARRQESALLRLEDAASLAAKLREIMTVMARATPTPIPPASGTWSWASGSPQAGELLVAQVNANKTAIPADGRVRPTVRVDFTGTLVRGLHSPEPSVHVQGAVFSGPRQVQALIGSLKKVVRSHFEQGRIDSYVSGLSPVSAFGF